MSESKRFLGILVGRIPRRALVKRHHDVGSDGALNIHYLFGRKDVLAPIDVRSEFSPFFTKFADSSQRKDLEATAVSQHRTVESIEFVQSASALNDFQTRAKIEVVRISQNNLCLDILFQFRQMDPLHGAEGTHRHKDRGLYRTVVGCDFTRTGIAQRVNVLQGELHALSSSFFLMVKSMGWSTNSLVRARLNTSFTSLT